MNRIKNKTLKMLCVVLVLLFSFTTLILTTFAAEHEGTCGENLTWFFNEETGALIISGDGPMFDFSYDNQPWLQHRDKISNVIIEPGVTSIGKRAFLHYSRIMNVTIAGTVEKIDDYAFNGCGEIRAINFSEGLKHIGKSAFEGILELNLVSIPDSVITIGDYAFYGCELLSKLKISKNVQSIGDYAFAGSSSLKTISIDECNEFYCTLDNVLFNKEKTTLIQYPNENKRISYTIPDTVTSISGMAFYECSYLTDIIIPESVKYIGAWCFDENEESMIMHYLGNEQLWTQLITNSDEENYTLLDTIPHYCSNQGSQVATCQNEGYSDGWYCEECEKFVIQPQKTSEINLDNHNFDESGKCVCGATADAGINNNFGFSEQMKFLEIILELIQFIFNLLF